MTYQHTQRFVPALSALSLALAAAFATQQAHASAFQLAENSAISHGHADAGEGAAPGDCAVVVNNPAAMSLFDKDCVQGTLSAINFSAKFHGSGQSLLDGATTSGGNGGNGGTTLPVPAVFWIHPFNDQFSAGLGVNVPFGFQTEYNDRWVGRYNAVKTLLQAPDITLSGSWKISDEFSLGASLIAQRMHADLISDIDLGTILAVPTNGALMPGDADGQGRVTGSSWGYGFGLGALWKPTAQDNIGLDFHSRINHSIDNGVASFAIPSNLLPLFNGAFTNTSGSANIDTPWWATASWWHQTGGAFSFGATASYTHWSSFKQLVVNYDNPAQAPYNSADVFDYKDSWFYSIGGDYKLDEKWTLRAGLGYDQTPTTNATRDPKVPDSSRTWLSFGAGWQVNDHFRLDASFLHLFAHDTSVNDVSATYNTLTGSFTVSGNVLSVAGQYLF